MSATCLKSAKITCAVSGLRYATDESVSMGPTCVLNMRLNLRASSSAPPQNGHFSLCFFTSLFTSSRLMPSVDILSVSSMRWSALVRCLHFSHSRSGSEKEST